MPGGLIECPEAMPEGYYCSRIPDIVLMAADEHSTVVVGTSAVQWQEARRPSGTLEIAFGLPSGHKLNVFLYYSNMIVIEKIIVIINKNNSLWALANYVLLYSKKRIIIIIGIPRDSSFKSNQIKAKQPTN